ncbi:hypothetical protein [Streptomyces phaeofaciens]|uniref:hypothetical protein n=1 Tax=Streptomyces phaeofaciens TaxID=68254 RepID=UPI0016763842|nr:hypothetical protein [Streptomyces phaeofaciens]
MIFTGVGITPLAQAAQPDQAAPVAEPDVGTVAVTSSNSVDVTSTEAGKAELADFTGRHSDTLRTAGARSLTALQSDYKVLQIDMDEVFAAAGTSPSSCDVQSETLVAPKSATNITYRANTEAALSANAGSDVCQFNVEWDAETPDLESQDDPAVAAAARPYVQKYASACFSRKWHYENLGDDRIKSSWNDGCHQNWVERNDGNRTWNYYSVKVTSTCRGERGRLTSCGYGVERATSGPTVHWEDWAPNASQDRNDCRSRSLSVSLLNASVGGEFDICEKQLINKYEEAGKMSSYWKGKVTDSARGTAHQVAVKVGQNAGRPKWHHWLNSDVCLACYHE